MASAGAAVRYGQVDREYGMRLATTPPEDDGPIWMVNLMKYREKADYADGRESDISGKEADDRYTPLGPLKAIGAEPVFFADVDTQFLNDTPKWDRVGIVKYPSRRAFIEMQHASGLPGTARTTRRPGMAETIVCGCLPMPIPTLPDDAPDVGRGAAPADGGGPLRGRHPRHQVQGRRAPRRDGHLHRPRGQDRRAERRAPRGVDAGGGHDPG